MQTTFSGYNLNISHWIQSEIFVQGGPGGEWEDSSPQNPPPPLSLR